MSRIFTIGHSSAPSEELLDLLDRFAIGTVVDVRSMPYSRHVPWYDTKKLAALLAECALGYLFAGDRLGGKPAGLASLPPGQLFARVRSSEAFSQGIDDLLARAATGERLCLLCAEEDPERCHRHHLVAQELVRNRGVEVWHIRHNGSLQRALSFREDDPRQLQLF